ncbi:MAG TPA: DNA repair protein RecO [Anaerolineae bacterium]|jgi:DNA repair protein RecO (recombination protein O)|nr:DNA repair protein RecO [Anaerolineae bacterium]
MSLYKTKGVVLKTQKLGESDRIITILTNNYGKVSAVAKGVRKTRSKFGSRLEPFTHVDLVLYKGRNLDIVTQAEIIDSFSEIRENFDRITYGSAMLDLVNKVSVEGERDIALYHLLLRSLKAVSQAKKNFRLLLIAFDIKLMAISGFRPKLERCVVCEEKPGVKARFSFEQGGIICEECNPSDKDSIVLTPSAIEVLLRLIKLPLNEVIDLSVIARLEDELYFLMRDYITYYTQARLKSREYLSQLIHS